VGEVSTSVRTLKIPRSLIFGVDGDEAVGIGLGQTPVSLNLCVFQLGLKKSAGAR
jgi:hypothetical protein